MTNTLNFARKALRGGTALQALALMGAGVGMVALAAPAAAQDYTQVTATGRIAGTDGNAIPGATVVITSNDQGFSRTVTAGADGAYSIPALPIGTYTFTVSASGYQTLTDDAVVLNQTGAANQFTLAAVGASGTDIVVTAGRVRLVDFNSNTTGTVVNVAELAQRAPISRDLTSVVLLSPGSTQGDTAFTAGGALAGAGVLPSLNGASVSENVYYLNGLNVTSFRNGLGSVPVPFELYQTVDIKNGGMQAEFGRTTGGAVIATTKSGSNTFHGSVQFTWSPDDLRSDAPNTYASDNDSARVESKDTVFQLSGPIIKDHLFFYGLYQFRDFQSSIGSTGTVSNQPVAAGASTANSCVVNSQYCTPFGNLASANLTLAGTGYQFSRNRSPFYAGKIDAVIIDGQRLEFTYFNTTSSTQNDIYGTSSFSLASGGRYNPNTNAPGRYVSSNIGEAGGENYVGRYTGTFTNWLTVSGAYGVYKNRVNTQSTTPDLPSIVDTRSGGSVSVGNTLANADISEEKRKFYRADADLTVKLFGTHRIRGGYDREELTLNGTIQANGGAQVTLAVAGGPTSAVGAIDPATGLVNRTPYATLRTFVSGGQFKTINEAYYIQDNWSLLNNRLQLNLGVRNDRFNNKNADGVTFYKSGDQFAPRVGFSFDPTGGLRTKIYGSFSRYFVPVAANTNLRLAGAELDYDAYYLLNGVNSDFTPILGAPITTVASGALCPGGSPAGTSCVVRNDGVASPTETTVASNLKPQSTDEYILGAEQRVGRRMKFGAYFTQVRLNESLEDASLDQALVPYCITQGYNEATCRREFAGVHQYALINPGSPVSIIVDASSPVAANAAAGVAAQPNGLTRIDGQAVTLSAASLQYPQAERRYRAMTFTFDREFDGKWEIHGSYTYSKLVGNIEGGIRSDNSQTDSGLTSSFDLPAITNGSFGYLPNDRRHNFKLYGNYQFTDWFLFGVNAQITSPRRFGCIGKTPAYADYNSVQTGGIAGPNYGSTSAFYCFVQNGQVVTNPVGFSSVGQNPTFGQSLATTTLVNTPRGRSFKSEWLYNVNLEAQFRVPVDAFDAKLRVSVFNAFNIHQKLDYQEVGNNNYVPFPVYGQPLTYQAPRSVRLQLGVGF